MSEIAPCPFCGGKMELMSLMTPIKMFYCLNYWECGAAVSFNNPKCDGERDDKHKIACFNRRTAWRKK